MSTSILDQNLISIKEASGLLPGRPHVSTIWRWIERGVGGHRLPCFKIGGHRYISRTDLESFIMAISGTNAPKSVTSKQRVKAIAKADAELAEFGL